MIYFLCIWAGREPRGDWERVGKGLRGLDWSEEEFRRVQEVWQNIWKCLGLFWEGSINVIEVPTSCSSHTPAAKFTESKHLRVLS